MIAIMIVINEFRLNKKNKKSSSREKNYKNGRDHYFTVTSIKTVSNYK